MHKYQTRVFLQRIVKKRFMKRLVLMLMAGFFAMAGYAQEGHNIRFRIDGLTEGACIMAHYYADQNTIVDTSDVTPNGEVVFRGKEKLLNGVYILVLPSRNYIEFIVPKEDQTFEIQFDTTLKAENKKVLGSEDNTAFIDFDKFAASKGGTMFQLREKFKAPETTEEEKEELRTQMKTIDEQIKGKRQEIITNYPNTFTAKLFRAIQEVEIPEDVKADQDKQYFYYREHYWDNIDLSDDGMIRTPIFKNKLEYYLTKVYVQMPDTLIPVIDDLAGRMEKAGAKELFKYTVWWTTNHYEESKRMCMDKVLHHMAKNYYCAGRSWWADTSVVRKMCEHAGKIEAIRCGEVAPDLTMQDTTFARSYTLSQIKYPVTVLVFWDHKCGHCKKELPKIKAMYDSLKGQGVMVYAVYTQGDWEGWKKYVRENDLNWINVMDAFQKTNFRDKYNIISTPQTYILDENKEIMFKNAPADKMGEIVGHMLDEYNEKQKAE
jgi:peroxiredoxin